MHLRTGVPESVTALQDAGLNEIWKASTVTLDHLDLRRNEWASFDELKPLMNQADRVFVSLAFTTSWNDAGGVSVDIPYTPETMPNNPYAQFLAAVASRKPVLTMSGEPAQRRLSAWRVAQFCNCAVESHDCLDDCANGSAIKLMVSFVVVRAAVQVSPLYRVVRHASQGR